MMRDGTPPERQPVPGVGPLQAHPETAALQRELADQEVRIRDLSQVLAEQAGRLAGLEEGMARRAEDEAVAQRRDDGVRVGAEANAERAEDLRRLSETLVERSNRIAEVEEQVRMLESVREDLEDRVGRLARQVELLGRIAEQKQRRMAEMDADLYRSRHASERLQEELEAARRERKEPPIPGRATPGRLT